MEEADVLATQVAILSRRILVAGTSRELRKRYSNVYEVHLVLATSPASTDQETKHVEAWVRQMFAGASFEGVNLGGQIRFVIDAARPLLASHGSQVASLPGDKRSRVHQLIKTLEEHKESIGIAYYTVGMGTLEMVFLKIVKECNVVEEEEKAKKPRWK
jgi:ATP-binding cassette subfamily A (ABC1) protein 3